MCRLKANQHGVTLIELLVVLALMSLVIGAGWNAFALAQSAWERHQLRWQAEATVRLASQMINHELTNASFVEIRNTEWNTSELEDGDRIIMVVNGEIIIREIKSAGNTDTIIATTEDGTLTLSFTKPLNTMDGNSPHHPIANCVSFSITAQDSSGTDICDLKSVITLSNMLRGKGFPVSSSSLYSTPELSNYQPGDRIRYRTEVDRFSPTTPDLNYPCGG